MAMKIITNDKQYLKSDGENSNEKAIDCKIVTVSSAKGSPNHVRSSTVDLPENANEVYVSNKNKDSEVQIRSSIHPDTELGS